jgi:hypothetical protein
MIVTRDKCVWRQVNKTHPCGVVGEFKLVDAPERIQFCNWMLRNAHDGLVNPRLLLITDEAYFCLSISVSSQNPWIWSDENSHTVHLIPLHDTETRERCAVSVRRIVGPVLCDRTLNSDCCIRNYFLNSWLVVTVWLFSIRQCYYTYCTKLWRHCKTCSMTESLIQVYCLQGHLVFVFVTSFVGEPRRKSVLKHN